MVKQKSKIDAEATGSLLENLVLARIERDGPITAYRVRALIEASPTDALSSSTGSIYPLLRRLQARGLLERGAARDGRGTRLLSVTEAGSVQVLRWLLSDDGARHLAEDPLRTKASFVGRLTPAQRRRWLRAALRASEEKLAQIEAFFEREALPEVDYWAHENAVRLMRARIGWLQTWLAHEGGGGASSKTNSKSKSKSKTRTKASKEDR